MKLKISGILLALILWGICYIIKSRFVIQTDFTSGGIKVTGTKDTPYGNLQRGNIKEKKAFIIIRTPDI